MENRVNVQNQSGEREIHLADLLWKILYSWRFIFVCAVIFAVLLAGGRFWKDRQSASLIKDQPSLGELKESLTEEESESISKAQALQHQITSQKKYQAESIRMNLDAYAIDEVILQYYVDTDYAINLDEEIQKDYGEELVWAYTSFVENNSIQGLLGTKLDWGIDSVYIGELLSVKSVDEGNQFTLVVAGADAEQAEELAEQAAALLEEYQSTLADKIGSHKLILLDRCTTVANESALADEKNALDERIAAQQTKLEALTAAFSAAQLQVYQGEDEETDKAEVIAVTPGFSVKYLVLGAFVGIFLSCVWLAICFILNGRIKDVRELQELYGLSIFGSISTENQKKRFLTGIDRWLDSLHRKGKWIPEEQQEVLLTNLELACKRENAEKLFVILSAQLSQNDSRLLEALKQKLEKKGIGIVLGKDVLHNAELLEQMAEIGQAVLVEKAEVSSYTEIEQELTLCAQHQINVLGAIGLE